MTLEDTTQLERRLEFKLQVTATKPKLNKINYKNEIKSISDNHLVSFILISN